MGIVEWEKKYNLGIEQIDTHHQYLVGLLNSCYDSFTAGGSVEEQGHLLDTLVDYSTYHFHAEEELMQKSKYPDYFNQAKEHKHFTDRVTEIQTDYVAGRKYLTLEIIVFLIDWLKNHILVDDAAFGSFAATRLKA